MKIVAPSNASTTRLRRINALARRAFDARARKSGYEVVNLNYMIYETMNRAGSVFKVIDRNSGNRLIMKRLKTRCSHSACLQEEDAWNLINARISRMSKFFARTSQTFVDGPSHYILFSQYKRNLRDAIRLMDGPFPVRHVREILVQLASGLEFLHNAGIVHCNVSPDAILMVDDTMISPKALVGFQFVSEKIFRSVEIRITNLSSAIHLPFEKADCKPITIGSNGYRAPEICAGLAVDAAADLFSIGLIIHEVATGHAVLGVSPNAEEAIRNMEDVLGPFDRDLSIEVNKAVPGVLSQDPESLLRRPLFTAEDVSTGAQFTDLMVRMIRLNPKQRPRLRDVARTSGTWPCRALNKLYETRP